MLAVVTAADFPELPVGATIPMGETGYDMWMVAQINMARHKVHWVGQPVAAVAAVDAHVAEAALALIEVDYEPLPAVLDIAAAMAADAPVLHEHVFTKGVEPRPRTPSNVCSRTVIARGDARARARRGCRHRARQRAGRHRAPGLSRAAGGGGAGRCQRLCHGVGLHPGPVHRRADDRRACSGLPLSKLKVVPLEIGGGFGGKIAIHGEAVAVRLAQKCRRPGQARAVARGGAAGRLRSRRRAR